MTEKHSRQIAGGRAVWYTRRLWDLARQLPVRQVAIDDIREFDQNSWFGETQAPTWRAVAAHAERIWNADLSFPVMLSADGGLMDGAHRLAKAWPQGSRFVRAVQFDVDPEPDHVVQTAPNPAHHQP
ncbi:MAG TPA: hypothetical protein VEW66_03705 [Thermomicrobiales bacterium]|nr:hypothetical protein [Thermomicrobiales bacterium]